QVGKGIMRPLVPDLADGDQLRLGGMNSRRHQDQTDCQSTAFQAAQKSLHRNLLVSWMSGSEFLSGRSRHAAPAGRLSTITVGSRPVGAVWFAPRMCLPSCRTTEDKS